jgi:hypothetical protein
MGLYSKANQAAGPVKRSGLLYKTSQVLAETTPPSVQRASIKPALTTGIRELIDKKHAFFVIKMSLSGLVKDFGERYSSEDLAAFEGNLGKFYKTLFHDIATVWEQDSRNLIALVDSDDMFDPDHLLHQVMHATRSKYENLADDLTWNLFQEVRIFGPEVTDVESWIAGLI